MQGSAEEGNGAATDRFDLAGQLLPFVCDGRVDEEKLYELLNAGAEFSALDFKQTLVLAEPKKKLDFVKDCAAMMNLPGGGYIVVGATDDGQLASEIEPPKKAMFDSASLGEIVRGYVDSHVDIRAQFHPQVRTGSGTGPMVLIYVAPPPDGLPAVISQDGTWTGNGRPKAVFHAGTVFVRRGTSNSVATHQSWAWILENYRNRVRTEAQSDVQVLVRRVVEQMGAGVREEPVAPDVAMDPDTFVAAVKRNMDDNRINQLKRFLLQVKGRYLASTDSSSDRTTVLDRITALGCESLLLENYEVLKMALDALDSLYRSHLDRPTSTQGSGSESPARWLEIILRVHVIGALAVRTAAWEAVPELVFHRIGDDTYSYQSWLRHALTEAARSNLLNGDTNRARGGLTLAWARELIAHRPDLRPDILQAEVPVLEGNDPLLDSLCQWDFLWCCIALSGGKGSSHEFYPSCAAFHGYRAEPIIDTLDSREDVRHELFDNADDETVASSIANVISMAERESWNYGGYWAGSSHLSPTGFIRTNAVIT